jgi:exo-beta-1,3-glucanase (GH17 family)/cellulose synthase/poly-beta-1,6-N-acetylglucosamine synthase-like glycosyltransferase
MSERNRISNYFVAAVFALLTFGLWAYLNRPTQQPAWPPYVQGFDLAPFTVDKSPLNGDLPTVEEIDSYLAPLQDKARAVRIYQSSDSFSEVPRLAAKYKLNVALTAWLDKDPERNKRELTSLIKVATENDNVIRLAVGNEVILRGDMTVAELSATLDRVRHLTHKPVSTAEPWNVWVANPELAEHVDYIMVHMFPYWEGIAANQAVEHVVKRMELMQRVFPDKPIVIGEIGWPSEGRTRGSAVPSPSNEAMFLRNFLKTAKAKNYTYYLMEAFDQPWKSDGSERGVGAYWGVYDSNRQPKFEFVNPIVRVPEWHTLAALSVVISALLLGLFYMNSRTLQIRGRSFLAIVVYGVATVTVYIVYDYSQQYLTVASVLVGLMLILGMLGVIAVLLAEAFEWAEAHWVSVHQRGSELARNGADTYIPKVSIHVPAYNEPPAMLVATLDALAALDYPNFEVLVIDNNTRDEAVWRPVEQHCLLLDQRLPGRFRFFHVDPLSGFKAGALNFALRNAAADAEIVAVIDSDYKVDRDWLRDLVPYFNEPWMGIVQAPQDYSDEADNAFKAMCYAEYKGFFHIGMITRNERNAIIQHGTMTLVRRKVLENCGGWAEWCITEDAELGVRVFERGYQAQYLPRSYGRGVMPDTFIDFKKQRFRWAYGAMQILRRHARTFLSGNRGLSAGQRYHFLAGWLPWLADGFNVLFTAGAVFWSIAMVVAPRDIEPPLLTFSVLPLTLFTFKLMKLIHLYVTRVGANLRQTFAAAIAGLALSHTIGIAVLKGLVTRNEPFFRTPKLVKPHGFLAAIMAARTETALMLALWACAIGVASTANTFTGPDLSVWIIVLIIQSLPYLATLLISLTSAFRLPATLLGRKRAMLRHTKASSTA